MAALGVWWLVGHWQQQRTPTYALEQIKAIQSEADLDDHSDYRTARGRKIYRMTISAANDFGVHPTFGAPTTDGDTMVAPFTDPKVEGRLEFKRDGVWQLDNLVLTKLRGQTYYADFSSVAEPLYAMGKALADKSPGQVQADDRYMTDKGKRVRLRLLEQQKDSHGSNDDTYCDEPVVSGDTAYFGLHAKGGRNELRFEVVRTYEGWKFDDMTVVKIEGRTINQSVAEQIDSPLWVWFKSAFW